MVIVIDKNWIFGGSAMEIATSDILEYGRFFRGGFKNIFFPFGVLSQ